jgi:hypothetical protein
VEVPLTHELKAKIGELFQDPAKYNAATMRKLLVSHYPHPRDHPTEVQIQSQMTNLMDRKKKAARVVVVAIPPQQPPEDVEELQPMVLEVVAPEEVVYVDDLADNVVPVRKQRAEKSKKRSSSVAHEEMVPVDHLAENVVPVHKQSADKSKKRSSSVAHKEMVPVNDLADIVVPVADESSKKRRTGSSGP